MINQFNFKNSLENQSIQGRSTSWLVSFGDLLTLLVCFFLSIISFTNIKKQANLAKEAEINQTKAVFHEDLKTSNKNIEAGTQLAVNSDEEIKANLIVRQVSIGFENGEFEGSKRQLSMLARQRLSLAVSSTSYDNSEAIISSCTEALKGKPNQNEWENSKLQALELKRQLIDAGWQGAPQEIRMQILGQQCRELDKDQSERAGKVAFVNIRRVRVLNG